MKQLFAVLILIGSSLFCFAQSKENQIYDYIDRHKDLAMKEMERYGIPASITLAQAIYATDAGMNKVSRESNNHFGITCHSNEWSGDIYYADENRGENYCFRKYATVADSYRDHSLFLVHRSRYHKLFYLAVTDYKSWARGLQEAGYSGNPHYADTLIALIEKYYIIYYDRRVAAKMGDTTALQITPVPVAEVIEEPAVSPAAAKPSPPASDKDTIKIHNIKVIVPKQDKKVHYDTIVQLITPPETLSGSHVFTLDPSHVPFKRAYYSYTNRSVYENNKTRFVLAKAGDTYKKLAASMQINEKKLREYNDEYNDEAEPIVNEVVYLEMKSTKSPVEYHILEQGDTRRYIAQKYGVQLKLIIKKNGGAFSSYNVGDKICIGCK